MKELAERAFVSQPQLYRIFYAATGHPVKEYIRKRRISAAARLLARTGRPLKEVAQESGFDSFQSFAKAFKKLTGVTPGTYKRDGSSYFSFEPIRLPASGATADSVKVVTMPSKRVYSYVFWAVSKNGLEPAAFQDAYDWAGSNGWSTTDTRFFGNDCPLLEGGADVSGLYGYRMLVIPPNETVPLQDAGQWQADTFPGGLYAVSSTTADCATTIIGAWNRLFSEWLPASRFERREGPFVEEFIQYKGKIARMHLYTPICRGSDQPFIRIVAVGRRQIVFTRSYGPGAYEEADGRLTSWIRCSGYLEGLAECSYYMSYGDVPSENGQNWWEAGVGYKGSILLDAGMDMKELGGGEYVCLTTETYGMLKGVLHRLECWLEHQEEYEPDTKREWFAEYTVRKDISPEYMRVICYLPVRPVRALSGRIYSHN